MTFDQHHYDKRWVNMETSQPMAYELVATRTVGGAIDYDWLEPVGKTLCFAENFGPVQYWMDLEDFHRYAPAETIRMMRPVSAKINERRAKAHAEHNHAELLKMSRPRKTKSVKMAQIDPSFAYADLTEEQYIELWRSYYPDVSGPLSTLKTVCALIESLAKLRGFDPSTWTR